MPPPSPADLPPPGPGWRWPPAGAVARSLSLWEERDPAGTLSYGASGAEPEAMHLRALVWLLDEHPRLGEPPAQKAGRNSVLLGVAQTQMPHGRVGHLYALDGVPLGAHGRDHARGVLWRWVHHRLVR